MTKLAVDLLDPELYRSNPHDLWTQLRHEEPVYRDEKNGIWALTRHHDVLEAERASEVFSSRGCYRANVGHEEKNMIAHDDPQHSKQRRLVLGRFTPTAMRSREDEMQSLIDDLLAPVAARGAMEVVEDLAAQLPSRLTARMLGLARRRVAHDQGLVRAPHAHRRPRNVRFDGGPHDRLDRVVPTSGGRGTRTA